MTQASTSNPQIADDFSPLETMVVSTLRRFGDYSPAGADGQTIQMFLEFANEIISEVRQHPYWTGEDIDYYVSVTDRRAVPDIIIRAGLLYLYAQQQGSQKAGPYGQQFLRDLNRELWNRANGNTRLAMHVVDGGSNPRNSGHTTTNPLNGTVTEDEQQH